MASDGRCESDLRVGRTGVDIWRDVGGGDTQGRGARRDPIPGESNADAAGDGLPGAMRRERKPSSWWMEGPRSRGSKAARR